MKNVSRLPQTQWQVTLVVLILWSSRGMSSRIEALHQRLGNLVSQARVATLSGWQPTTSRTNEHGEEESWRLEVSNQIMVDLTYKSGKWGVTSGTLPWFSKAILKATTLAEAKPAAIRVVQAFLRKNILALDPYSK